MVLRVGHHWGKMALTVEVIAWTVVAVDAMVGLRSALSEIGVVDVEHVGF